MGDTPGTLYALAVAFSLLAVTATVLRFYARNIKKVGFSWDDYAVIPALVFTIATAISMVIGTAKGDLGRHTQIGEQDGWPIPIITHRTKVFQQVSPAFASTIWALQMSVRRKLAVCGIFLLGALTVASGVAKIAIYYNILHRM
ncbi:MAG: hypothetical protein Q9225_004709 [Loekoesia sp. 1 TL-2023]